MLDIRVNNDKFEFEINKHVTLEDARGGCFAYNNSTKRVILLDTKEVSVIKFIDMLLKNNDNSLTIDKIIDYQIATYKAHEKEVPVVRDSVENIIIKLKQAEILVPRF